jgi:hypothetical protein
MSNQVCELAKNAREKIIFRLGEFKGRKFVDMRVFAMEEGKDPAPTKKGLAVSPALWPQFKAALAKLEEGMIRERWIDKEDIDAQSECTNPRRK